MAGWTSPRTWVAAAQLTAAQLNAHVRDNLNALNGYVVKTVDETRTSTTVLANDNALLYTIPATGTYIFDLFLFATSAANAAGDIKFGFTFPTGTVHFHGQGPDITLASGTAQTGEWKSVMTATSGVDFAQYGASTLSNGYHVHGILIATATGTLRLQWAQQNSSASATTLLAGSHMIVRQVA